MGHEALFFLVVEERSDLLVLVVLDEQIVPELFEPVEN